jgi:hypothetical protein
MAIVSTTAAEKPASPSIWSEDSQGNVDRATVFIHGPPGAGKTSVAATADRTQGEDTIWVQLDPDGVNGLLGSGYYVAPNQLIDVPSIRYNMGWNVAQLTKELHKAVKEKLKSDPSRQWVVIIDGITMLDLWIAQECPVDGRGSTDWRAFSSMHQAFASGFVAMPAKKVFLAHSKVDIGDVFDKSGEKNANQALAQGIAEGEVIKPMVTGAGLNAYSGPASLYSFMQKTYNPKGEPVYKFHTEGGDKARGKSRFTRFLEPTYINPNLADMFDTVKAKMLKEAEDKSKVSR